MIAPLSILTFALLTSSGGETRVSRQLLVKEGHAFVVAGPTWLSRADYYDSPGLLVSASFYPWESHGLELRAGYFASSLNRSARDVRRETGLLPDSHRPIGAALAGYRGSFGYGKLLVAGALIHFDLQATAQLGAFLTDRALTPAAAVGPAVLARINSVLHVQLDVSLTGALEQRGSSTVVLGVLPLLGIGARF